MFTIRAAASADVPAITDIYNDAVLNTTATFDVEARTLEDRMAWFEAHGPEHPILVAEQDGLVVGWAAMSRWSDRSGYAGTAEVSLYVRDGFRRRGIGGRLFEAILHAGQEAGLHTVTARIAEGNDASVRLCLSAGFEHIGTMREVGRKHGRLLDVHLMQMIYPTPARPDPA